MKLYDELAEWWPLLSPTEDYLEEAQELLALVDRLARQPVHRLLELGCGGGSLAHQLRDRFDLTLSDRSPAMVRESRRLNPDCEHVVADMRTIDLDRRFDAVLIHDAVMYLTGRADLRAAFEAARRHLHPEGLLVVMPDVVKERFEPGTDHGGHDGPDGRGLRYLEWRHDRDSTDDEFEVALALMLREADGTVHSELDRHRQGLFDARTWLATLHDAGFDPRPLEAAGRVIFAARSRP